MPGQDVPFGSGQKFLTYAVAACNFLDMKSEVLNTQYGLRRDIKTLTMQLQLADAKLSITIAVEIQVES